jgi:hypothetical protein
MTKEPASAADMSDDELRELIDAHDPPAPPPSDADDVLEHQRAEHADRPTDAPPTEVAEVSDDGLAPVINNVGDDGGAASG